MRIFHKYIKPNATEIEFIEGRIKFGKLDTNGNFYLPLNAKGKTQSGTKDSMVVVFDGRYKIGWAAMLEPVKIPQRLQRAETLK